MKKSYINPNTECITLQGNAMVCFCVSGKGPSKSQGGARAPQRRVGSIFI